MVFLCVLPFLAIKEIGGESGSAGGPSCLAPLRFFLTWALAWELPLDLNHDIFLCSCCTFCSSRLAPRVPRESVSRQSPEALGSTTRPLHGWKTGIGKLIGAASGHLFCDSACAFLVSVVTFRSVVSLMLGAIYPLRFPHIHPPTTRVVLIIAPPAITGPFLVLFC